MPPPLKPKEDQYWIDYYNKETNLPYTFKLMGIEPVIRYKIKFNEVPPTIQDLQSMISAFLKKKYNVEWKRFDIAYLCFDTCPTRMDLVMLTRGYIEAALKKNRKIYAVPD